MNIPCDPNPGPGLEKKTESLERLYQEREREREREKERERESQRERERERGTRFFVA